GLLSANLLAEAQKRNAQLCWLVDVALPGGTKSYSSHHVASAATGLYTGKITDWGTLTRSGLDRRNGFSFTDTAFVIDDTDRAFAKVVEGTSGNTVRNSTVTIKLASLALGSADWFTAFSGRLASWDSPAPYRIRLTCTFNDLPLRAMGPRRVATRADWPY